MWRHIVCFSSCHAVYTPSKAFTQHSFSMQLHHVVCWCQTNIVSAWSKHRNRLNKQFFLNESSEQPNELKLNFSGICYFDSLSFYKCYCNDSCSFVPLVCFLPLFWLLADLAEGWRLIDSLTYQTSVCKNCRSKRRRFRWQGTGLISTAFQSYPNVPL